MRVKDIMTQRRIQSDRIYGVYANDALDKGMYDGLILTALTAIREECKGAHRASINVNTGVLTGETTRIAEMLLTLFEYAERRNIDLETVIRTVHERRGSA